MRFWPLPRRRAAGEPAGLPISALEIRSLRPDETDAVARVLRHRVIVADRLARQRRGECLYQIAWGVGRPVGQVLVHWRRPPAVAVAESLDALPYLEDLYVLPEVREQGVASALLAATERAAAERGHPGLTLAVSLDNAVARRLYADRGYVEAGLPPHPQATSEHGADAVVRNLEEMVVDLVRWLPPRHSG
ncbi:MAG TPA: GNAT family N-acetyltransferase [Candidatus Binatia bacterium]|nr:GNAT family N-acetyltransferase [Candidatus Binatia bacterium]